MLAEIRLYYLSFQELLSLVRELGLFDIFGLRNTPLSLYSCSAATKTVRWAVPTNFKTKKVESMPCRPTP